MQIRDGLADGLADLFEEYLKRKNFGCLTLSGLGCLGVSGLVILVSTGGALLGGLTGEICDNTPYIYSAIPEGIGNLARYFVDSKYVTEATSYMTGNLDKLGAAFGFIGGFFGNRLRCKHNNSTREKIEE